MAEKLAIDERGKKLRNLTKKLNFKQSIANISTNVRVLRLQSAMIRKYQTILVSTLDSLAKLQNELKEQACTMCAEQNVEKKDEQWMEKYITNFFTTDNETHSYVIGANYCELRPSSLEFRARRDLDAFQTSINRIEGTLAKEEMILEKLESSKRVHDEFVEKHQQRYMEKMTLASDYEWKFEFCHCERLLPRKIVDFVDEIS